MTIKWLSEHSTVHLRNTYVQPIRISSNDTCLLHPPGVKAIFASVPQQYHAALLLTIVKEAEKERIWCD